MEVALNYEEDNSIGFPGFPGFPWRDLRGVIAVHDKREICLAKRPVCAAPNLPRAMVATGGGQDVSAMQTRWI